MISRAELVAILKAEVQEHRTAWDGIERTIEKTKEPNKRELEDLLQWACIYGYEALAIRLADEAINVDCETSNGKTPLMLAAEKGYAEIVRKLLEKRPNVNKASASGYTALMQAADRGSADIVRMLIDAGASKYIHDDIRKGLESACDANRVEIVRILSE